VREDPAARNQLDMAMVPSRGRLTSRIRPMRPTDGPRPFDDPHYLFEPWWPGARLIVFIENGKVRAQGDEFADFLPEFPELRELAGVIDADGVILDGVLVILDRNGRPAPRLLRSRLAGHEPRLGRPAFVAVDLLRAVDRPLAGRPFAERRRRLEELVRPTDWCAVSRGVIGEGHMLAEVAGGLGFDTISARHLSSRYRPGPAGDAWLRLPIAGAPAPGAGRRLPPFLSVFRQLPW
jgi:bifunctional non-homologous end joining protein LigD